MVLHSLILVFEVTERTLAGVLTPDCVTLSGEKQNMG